MIHARRTITALGGLATAGALVLGTPGLAGAAVHPGSVSSSARGLDPDHDKSVSDGDGSADGRAAANRQGRLLVTGNAEGGGTGGLGDEDTTANASAQVTGRHSAADGTYRVTVRYNKARGVDTDRNDGDADLNLTTRVGFAGPGAEGTTLRRMTELTGRARDRTVTFTYKVPNGESGRLAVTSVLKGSASAATEDDTARFAGSVKGVKISIKRIGG